MIVSHNYKFVFIHIPKNAGTFITELIMKLDPDALNIYSGDVGHQKYLQISESPLFNVIKDYKFFAVLRNPVEQLISWYNYTKKNVSVK
jgi:hypothetical protein